ncbi:hypothetical protein ACKWTF_015794 [Chironomus riparius]
MNSFNATREESASYSRSCTSNKQYAIKNENLRRNNQQKSPTHVKCMKIDEANGLNVIEKTLHTTKISPTVTINQEASRACKVVEKSTHNIFQIKRKSPKTSRKQKCHYNYEVVTKQQENTEFENLKSTCKEKTYHYKFEDLPTDPLEHICTYLNDKDKLNLISADARLSTAIGNSTTVLHKFKIIVNQETISSVLANQNLQIVPLKNLSIDFEGLNTSEGPLCVVNLFKNSIEHLELENAKFRNFDQFNSLFNGLSNLKSIILKKCSVDQHINKTLPTLSTLKTISLDKCNDNIFKALSSQVYTEKLTIRNDDWTWNGFPHEIVNDMLFNCINMKHLVLIGNGTGSFFDSDNFSFKLQALDTTMITFHWYVGIKNGRTSFLQTQKGTLKELTIHKLPFDFDGGKVLKYIIEEMNLNKFYYGKTPLILDGKKQDVYGFEANEIQITSAFEMLQQFPCIKFFRFVLCETDIASDEVEKRVNPPTKLFENLEEFEVVDKSRYRGTLGVFLGLFKKMRNIRKLTLITQDRNINTLLEEFLRFMPHLNEIYITSKVARVTERFKIINRFVPNLNKISVAPQYLEEAHTTFQNIQICETVEN